MERVLHERVRFVICQVQMLGKECLVLQCRTLKLYVLTIQVLVPMF